MQIALEQDQPLCAEAVTKRFSGGRRWLTWQGLAAIDDVSFEIRPREIYGVRGAIPGGESIIDLPGELALLTIFGAVLIPLGIATFAAAQHWAKKTGRLKRLG